MRIDVSLLPALAAAFMLVFARIGAMVMLLPGLGESDIPMQVKLSIALLLTLIILPLHRSAYHVDLQSMTGLLVLMLHEIIIGIVLGATARVTLSALQVAGAKAAAAKPPTMPSRPIRSALAPDASRSGIVNATRPACGNTTSSIRSPK